VIAPDADDRMVRKWVLAVGATAVAIPVLVIGLRVLGAASAAFAFLVVWVPMTGSGR
jgi:hypothetical protein